MGPPPIFNLRMPFFLVVYHILFVGGFLRVHGTAFTVGRRDHNVGHCP